MTNLTQIRVIITIMATLLAIIFILLTSLFPNYSNLILTIEVILLPSIYIIGNYYAENLIEERNKELLSHISSESEKLQEKYIKEKLHNIQLEAELKYLKDNDEKNEKKVKNGESNKPEF